MFLAVFISRNKRKNIFKIKRRSEMNLNYIKKSYSTTMKMNKLLKLIEEMNQQIENDSFAFEEPNMYGKKSPVECPILNSIAAVFFILFILGLVQNFYILHAFYFNKKLRTLYHTLIIWLTVFNFAGLLICYPIVITSKLKCRWVFDDIGCNFSSFVILFTASVIIVFMAAISVQR